MVTVSLTFDDGPGPSTLELLDVLRNAGCKATFFVLGANLVDSPEVAIKAVQDGHVLGNHTYSHARPGDLSSDALLQELCITDALILQAYQQAGKPAPAHIPVRLPYGVLPHDPRPLVLEKPGRSHVGWTMILDDWHRPQPAPEILLKAMQAHVSEQTQQGENTSFCLHDSSRHQEPRPATVQAVALWLASCAPCYDGIS